MSIHSTPRPSADIVDLHTWRPPAAREPRIALDQHDARDWTVVDVDGEMDLQVVPLLPDVAGMPAPHLAFVLRRVTFMDASALGALVRMQRETLSSGGCLRLVAPSRPVQRLLALTATERVFGVYDGLEEAMAEPVPTGPERQVQLSGPRGTGGER